MMIGGAEGPKAAPGRSGGWEGPVHTSALFHDPRLDPLPFACVRHMTYRGQGGGGGKSLK